MGILAFLLLGLVAGAIAKAVMPGDDGGGIFLTMVLGVIGAGVGYLLSAALFDAHPLDGFFELSSWICAIVGSIVVLGIYRMTLGAGDRHHGRV
ncbi:MAG: transglycosylase [Thermoleophilia bacterium]|nr:transglycosylase [Thermoleophilia bacterium]